MGRRKSSESSDASGQKLHLSLEAPESKRQKVQEEQGSGHLPSPGRSGSSQSDASVSVESPGTEGEGAAGAARESDVAFEEGAVGVFILPCVTGNLADDYILKDEELGRGQFGVVKTCVHRATGTLLACKTISKEALQKKQQIEALKTEIAVMAYLAGHPNIVEHVGVYEDFLSVHVVMELCRGGDLFDLIKQAKRLREVDAAWLFRKIVGAVSYCHERGLVHRDLKPENILVGMDGSVEPKLADFGLAMVVPPGHTLQGLAGSPSYMAPEIIWGEPYGASADIWSLGVILYFMLSGFLPFYGRTPMHTFSAVCRAEIDLTSPPWSLTSSGAKKLIKRMLCKDPSQRPTARDVLEHPWLLSFGPPASTSRKKQPFLIPCLPGHDIPASDLSLRHPSHPLQPVSALPSVPCLPAQTTPLCLTPLLTPLPQNCPELWSSHAPRPTVSGYVTQPFLEVRVPDPAVEVCPSPTTAPPVFRIPCQMATVKIHHPMSTPRQSSGDLLPTSLPQTITSSRPEGLKTSNSPTASSNSGVTFVTQDHLAFSLTSAVMS